MTETSALENYFFNLIFFFIIYQNSKWGRGLRLKVPAESIGEVINQEIRPEVEEIPKDHNGKYQSYNDFFLYFN